MESKKRQLVLKVKTILSYQNYLRLEDYLIETSEKFNSSFLCKQESIDYKSDSRFRENDKQIEIYFSEVSYYK